LSLKSICDTTVYYDYLKRLPQNRVLTEEVLKLIIKATRLNSCSRAKICKAFKKFGTFVGIDTSFIDEKLRGTYSSNRPAPRELPPDELIVAVFSQIPNPRWRWVYGVIAAYGLRTHEPFHLDTENLEQGGYLLKVLENTKTGYREVPPLHPEWVDQFGLRQKQLPGVTGKNNRDLGSRVGCAFRRYRLPFPSYHLRHCYATRCIRFKVEVTLAARWMGHSVAMHTIIYQAHLSKRIEQEAFERAINDPNRPQPPS
jgi:integrase